MRWTMPFTAICLCIALIAAPVEASEDAGPAAIPPPERIIERLRPEHPRLMATAGTFDRLRQRIASDAEARRVYESIRAEADRLLDAEPSRYEIPDGKRLLATSRRVMDRVYTLALAYRLEGERRYLERAWRELEAAAAFRDWNPSHFLDTAEMTHAFAIGYDWLHDGWSERQRRVLREAMVRHGLEPGLRCYRGEASYGWWTEAEHNWNQVCNGGLVMGALAIGDERPELAGRIIHHALRSLRPAMEQYAPDGAYAEGVSYWGYGTTYNVYLLAAIESALGGTFGFTEYEGFAETGLFPIYMTSPAGLAFNFADMRGGRFSRTEALHWLARRFERPACAWYADRYGRPTVHTLLWRAGPGRDPAAAMLPPDKHWRGLEAVTLRGDWLDEEATFIGFKAGSPHVNHGHADLGSFVLDALGRRWAVDLGSDDYNMPGYFDRGEGRWRYYRMRAEGHNTIVLNPDAGPDQKPTAVTRIDRFESGDDRALAIADLTAAYADDAESVRRGVMLIDQQDVLVQDEVRTREAAELWWFMHTEAEVEVGGEGRTAVLRAGGRRLAARILSPAGARFEVRNAEPLPGSPDPPMQAANTGVRKLAIHLSQVRDVRLAVLLWPVREGDEPAGRSGAEDIVRPLEAW